MKNIYKYLMLALVAVFGLSLTSCKDDDQTLSRKVYASVAVMEYDGEDPEIQIIKVVSDGDWVVEAPDWINVSPTSGVAGETEVEIIVTPNMRGGALDVPRRSEISFKGRNLESIATVLVKQDGDKFRDVPSYSISDVIAEKNEKVVSLPDMVVANLTGTGFIVTDGSDYMYIQDAVAPAAVGEKVSVMGEKHFDDKNMSYVLGEKITPNGLGTVPTVTPEDINATLDDKTGTRYELVTLTGNYNGKYMVVDNNASVVYLKDPHASLELDKLAGHRINVTGYFAGSLYPAVNIIPSAVADLGINELIIFNDDFEWLEPWAVAGKNGNADPSAADSVGDDKPGGEAPQITQCSIDVDGVKVNAGQAMEAKGYKFLRVTPTSDNADECIYLQRNYLKMGKTGYQAGLVLPNLDIEEGKSLEVKINFDWCIQRTNNANAKYDTVSLIVVVKNGDQEKTYDVAPSDLVDKTPFRWMNTSVTLKDVSKDSEITIKQKEWKVTTANRWYIDNIRITSKI